MRRVQLLRSAVATFARPEDIEKLLRRRVVAVVGISTEPSKPSYHVAESLQQRGKKIIPVRPGSGSLLGEPIINCLSQLPTSVDRKEDLLVNVFRRPEDLDSVVDEAIAAGVTGMWFQLKVVNEKAFEKARQHGITVVADRCLWVELRDSANQ
jgi:predicted CoA-binding protein